LIRVGISACLLGQPVRWDGGHKRDAELIRELGRRVEWVPVCPEVEVGMGVPRPPLHLLRGEDGAIRMLENESGHDHTAAMRAYALRRAGELARLGLCGYVLKSRSPSCGLAGVELRRASAPPRNDGRGLFAQALAEALPWLPVEEEEKLRDTALREAFLARVLSVHAERSGGRGAQ
jgi:uncharacterized protein YbbK (DUF523 family)